MSYNPDDNPAAQLALGRVTFRIEFAPTVPAERITILRTVNIEQLRFA